MLMNIVLNQRNNPPYNYKSAETKGENLNVTIFTKA